MNDQKLRQELDRVSLRYRRLLLWTGLAVCWLVLALAGAALLAWARGGGYAVPGIALVLMVALPAALLPIVVTWLRRIRNPLWIARRIEKQFPDLDARLLAALEQRPDGDSKELGFLQQTVIKQAVDHSIRHHWWIRLVPQGRMRAAQLAQWAMLIVFGAVVAGLIVDIIKHPSRSSWWMGGSANRGEAFEIRVEPGDTDIERGTKLLVQARFGNSHLPGDVKLLYRDAEGQVQQMPMSKSLDDPLFAGRVTSVVRDMTYAVRYGSAQTRWYKVGVFDYPELKQADARLKFPEYTGAAEKLVEDTRSVTAVEGTRATITFRLNKAVAEARLVPKQRGSEKEPVAGAAEVNLVVDPKDPSVYSVALDLKQSQKYQLQLVDSDHRSSKEPAELAINVTPNKPPELKLQLPGHDVDVSPLEEMAVKAQVYDDYGVKRVGLSYSIAGQESKDVVLAEGVAGKDRREVAQLISLEQLRAQPDQLLSYHLWAEDIGPDGKVRRVLGDMFFAEVRPFEEIFRQGEQPAGGEEQKQQQQQAGQNAQKAEELAELQKQIIAATWKVMRREIAPAPTAQYVPDVKLIEESQGSAKEKAEALGEKLTDERSQALLQNVLKYMDEAIQKLTAAEASTKPLPGALAAEQAAYQGLLKLRAREHEVIRGKQQQGKQSSSSASARQQRQLNQLELANQDNRYETQRSAAQQQQGAQEGQQKETRQVLNRLRELAQRQEDLNKQMKELQSALEKAREQAQREELQRQLARLRDQQQQMLRDTDELRDRMDQPENQERMADSRQQLEQTRNNVQKASESLQQGKVPDASAAGQRASEQFNNLREQVSKKAAGQFDEAMNQMRDDAQKLEKKEQELSQKMADADGAGGRGAQKPPALREKGQDRQQIAQELGQQKEKLEKLLENMRQTVEEAETPQPLLSKQLYEAIRKTRQEETDKALDTSKQLLDRGLMEEARKSESEAGKGITQLREGVEQAAKNVLGGQTESLRRARNELDELNRQLEREMAAAGAKNGPTTQRSGEQLAQNTRDGRKGEQQAAGQRDGQQRDGQQAGQRPGEGKGQQGEKQQGQQQAQAGERGQGQQGQQPGEKPGEGQGQQQADAQAKGQRAGQQGQGEQPGEKQGEQPAEGQQAQAQGQGKGQQAGNQPRADARGGGLRQLDGPDPERDPRRSDERRRNSDPFDPNERDPITGGGFREWSDRMRDVEELVGDPRLRAEAARIRERAGAVRAEFKRHSEKPKWNVVQEMVGRPLIELRDAVAQELMRRESSEALVPIDREPVPPGYADQVRRYYERLGSGK
jgi:DNA polymerase III delta prime subunit